MCLICCQPLTPKQAAPLRPPSFLGAQIGEKLYLGIRSRGFPGSPHMVWLLWQGQVKQGGVGADQLVACECCSRLLCLLRCQTSCGVRGALWQSPQPPTSHVSFSWEEAQGLQWSRAGRSLHRGHRAVPSTVGSWALPAPGNLAPGAPTLLGKILSG